MSRCERYVVIITPKSIRIFSVTGTLKHAIREKIGLKVITYNLIVLSDIEAGKKPRKIMKIASC